MATIHRKRLRSGRSVWELTHGRGVTRVRFVAGKTREEAEGVLAQFKQQLRMHGSAPHDLTVSEAVQAYREYLVLNRREKTVVRYCRVLDTFAICFLRPFHMDVGRLRDIKPQHIEDYKRRRSAGEIAEVKTPADESREQQLRSELARNPKRHTMKANAKYGWLGRHSVHSRVSVRTINYELRCLFTFFRWAIKQNHLFVNPVTNIEKFRVPKRSLPRFMTSEEIRKFFAACREDERRLFSTILLTGMRKGEIEHLTWNDLNFDLGILFIQAKPEVSWQPKTDERVIPISPTVQQLLFEQYANRTSEQWVFANSAGQRDGHILEKLKNVCRRAGIKPATVHALRHSFGAHLRMADVSLADIADLLGHKDLATTQIYAKVQQEHLSTVIGKLTGLLPAAPKSTDASLKRVTHGDHPSIDDRKLLTNGHLDDQDYGMAERKGFEPLEAFRLQRFSRPPPSTTRPPLRSTQFFTFNNVRGYSILRQIEMPRRAATGRNPTFAIPRAL
jgi:integrase